MATCRIRALRDAIKRYNAEGIEGLHDRPRAGRPTKLSETQRSELRAIVVKGPDVEAEGLSAYTRDDLARIEDLYARLNLWSFALPSLRDRREDVEPNLDFELSRFAEREGTKVTFNREARQAYLTFATAPEAEWRSNFRDLGASVTRMATLAPGGRINEAIVAEEVERLRSQWRGPQRRTAEDLLTGLLGPERTGAIDLFDRIQLEQVIRICREHSTLSAAGRKLFTASRARKTSSNDADRLRKYLARFDLDWQTLTDAALGQ